MTLQVGQVWSSGDALLAVFGTVKQMRSLDPASDTPSTTASADRNLQAPSKTRLTNLADLVYVFFFLQILPEGRQEKGVPEAGADEVTSDVA